MSLLHDPLSDIELIANNLRDRYKSGFPILKEMVQNADDAKANNLVIGWHPGINSASHPLLKDPAIFIVNDAELTEADVKGIRTLGLGSKASDANAVGKFGLGMKSLFHFGELYFFIGSDWEEYSGPYPKADILNPWDFERPQWKSFSNQDKKRIQEELSAITDNFESDAYKFIVWIPLRSTSISQQRGESATNFIRSSEDYGMEVPDFLLAPNLASQLGKLLPMLKCLRSIKGATFSPSSKTLTTHFTIEIEPSSERIQFPNLEGEIQWQGSINLNTLEEGFRSKVSYVGTEAVLQSSALSDLKQNEFWPITRGRNDAGEEVVNPDKTQPHSAAILLTKPTEQKAKFTVGWAVFLPLGEQDTAEEKQVFEIDIDGGMSFDILLHGYFFIDAGRVGIHGRKSIGDQKPLIVDSEDSATQEWNRLVANEGTLPRLLSSVSLASPKLTQLQVEELSRGIREFLKDSIGISCHYHVTSAHQWVYQVSKESRRWNLVCSSLPIRKLPKPKSDEYERIWNTFPSLFSIRDEFVFIDDSKSNIISLKDANWQDDELVDLFNSVETDVFESQKLLSYLNTFLRSVPVYSERCQVALIRITQSAFKKTPLVELSKNQSAIREFVSLIRPIYRWAVKVEKSEQPLWNMYSSVDTSKLFIPAFLDTGDSTKALDFDDADRLLAQLGKQELNDRQLSKATESILASFNGSEKDRLFQRHDSLKLFGAYEAGNNTPYRESIHNLKRLLQRKRLFCRASLNSGSFIHGGHLREALSDSTLVFISDKVNQQLFGGKVQPCEIRPVLDLLSTRPLLKSPKARANLISKLEITDHLSSEQRLSIRYLIHGRQEDTNTSTTLWSVGGDDAVWSRIHKASLSNEQRWTIIPHELSNVLKLNPQEKKVVNLEEVNATTVVDNLGDDIQYIDFSEVINTQNEAEEVLQRIENSDTWRALPLHRTRTGEFHPIISHCFLETSIELPEELENEVVWIRPAISKAVQTQQKENVQQLDACKAIELALSQDTPSQHQNFILEKLDTLNSLKPIAEKLRTVPWLVAGKFSVSPNMVLLADKDTWRVTHRLSQISNSLYFAAYLDLFKDSRFDLIKDLFISNLSDIAYLAIESAAKLPDFFIGRGNVTNDVLKQALQYKTLFENAELYGWELIIECFSLTDEASLNLDCIVGLQHDIVNSSQLIGLHERLVKEASSASVISKLRHTLLSMISNTSSQNKHLEQLTLRTQSDEFASSQQLCHGVAGVANSALLHDDDYEAIKHALPNSNVSELVVPTELDSIQYSDLDPNLMAASTTVVEDYFADWEPHITNKTALAAVLALMSGTPGIKKICEDYLGQRTYSNFIKEIGKNWVHEQETLLARVPETLEKFVSLVKFDVKPVIGKTTTVTSILNQQIKVKLETDNESIFVWDTTRLFYSEPISIEVRKIAVAEMDETQLLTVLKNSAELFLAKVYRQNLTLDHIWDEFSGAEQLDIRAAKLTVMDGIVHQLKELQLKDIEMSKLLKEYDQLVTSAAESNQNVGGDERRSILEKICNQVETNNVKSQVLDAVKQKIEQAQYHAHSVPFELFQNADDAVVELRKLGIDDVDSDHRGIFRVKATKDKITFFNWGREVNQYRTSSSNIDGSEFGFKTDLQKMIVRNQSDKGATTTGKFGLGFKSCLLVTDTPHIVSGRLAVQIEGGLLPSLSNDHEYLFQLAKDEKLQSGLRPTVISLTLREGIGSNEVLSRFKKQAGLLTIFSKRIRTIELDEDIFQWKPIHSRLIDGVTLGVTRIPTKKRNSEVRVVVVSTESGCFVFGLGDKGLKPLNPNLPKLWNLSPLMGDFNLGFAINAAFEVDIGRNQLAISSQINGSLFEHLGKELNKFLSKLYFQCNSDWEALKVEWGLQEDLEVTAFWESVWNALHFGSVSKARQPGEEDIDNYANYTNSLFTTKGGILSFYDSYQAFPIGLKGSKTKLVCLASVSYRTGELLDSMLKYVAKLPVMVVLLEAQQIVGFDNGKSLLALGKEISTLELGTLIEKTLDNNFLSPVDAETLRHVFDSNFDSKLKKSKATQEQVDEFRGQLNNLSVLAENGSHRSINETLINQPNKPNADEAMIIEFAPSEYIASLQYKSSTELLELCRRDVTPYDIQKLFHWVCRGDIAANADKQQSVCRYLVEGSYGEALAEKIKLSSSPRWLLGIDIHQLKSWGWDKKQIDLFINVRMVTDLERYNRVNEQLKVEGKATFSAEEALMNVFDWWEDNKGELLPQYEREMYPEGIFTWDLILKDDLNDPNTAKAWLKLLYLGSCQTIGRTRERQHKGAIALFERKGWWDVFINTEKTNAQAWFEVIDQYLDDSINDEEYRNWLQLLPIYRLSRDLEDYVELLYSSEQFLENLDDFLRPGSSSKLDGSGMAVPELKATLGIGTNFVFRELIRNKVFDVENLKRFSYVPSLKVREFFAKLGCNLDDNTWSPYQSAEIYDFIEEHIGEDFVTFSDCFDIPFRILMSDKYRDLREKLLGIGYSE
ncbi:sacsin N-terminal ATP-binding-like domain-containing protein [Shewanella kaireitica]|uniref:sacsin N-terminal ATP-binding-like domain-containing protein n=1 Tax=Shewanella kaireitica TaxID=212021 RepID=UPI0020100C7C|nr:hypothetical protein [Shewanella kaireitica]MCL1092796.1 hypothetical protein [Shewanella kaireitica]